MRCELGSEYDEEDAQGNQKERQGNVQTLRCWIKEGIRSGVATLSRGASETIFKVESFRVGAWTPFAKTTFLL